MRKTRLGLQVAADALEQFPDGVWLVELAPLSDPSLVAPTVATRARPEGRAGQADRPDAQRYLKDKRLLVLLDNCEHLLDACAKLADALLRQCAGVRILASSREALGIGGEQTYRVPSLSLPDPRRRRRRNRSRHSRRCSFSSIVRCSRAPISGSPRRTRRRSRPSALGWTGFRWRSSSRRRGCGRFRSSDRPQPGRALPPADRRLAHGAAAPADAARAHRLELRPARRTGEAAVAAAVGLRGRMDARGGRADLRRRWHGGGRDSRSADLARRQEPRRRGPGRRRFALPARGNGAPVRAGEAPGKRRRRSGARAASRLLSGAGRGGGAEARGCGTGGVVAASRGRARQPARGARVERRVVGNGTKPAALRRAAAVLDDARPSFGGCEWCARVLGTTARRAANARRAKCSTARACLPIIRSTMPRRARGTRKASRSGGSWATAGALRFRSTTWASSRWIRAISRRPGRCTRRASRLRASSETAMASRARSAIWGWSRPVSAISWRRGRCSRNASR